jgi:hypothetical protein
MIASGPARPVQERRSAAHRWVARRGLPSQGHDLAGAELEGRAHEAVPA